MASLHYISLRMRIHEHMKYVHDILHNISKMCISKRIKTTTKTIQENNFSQTLVFVCFQLLNLQQDFKTKKNLATILKIHRRKTTKKQFILKSFRFRTCTYLLFKMFAFQEGAKGKMMGSVPQLRQKILYQHLRKAEKRTICCCYSVILIENK